MQREAEWALKKPKDEDDEDEDEEEEEEAVATGETTGDAAEEEE